MGKQEYLIDTNVAIQYIGETLPEKALSFLDRVIDSAFSISVINRIELLGFADITEKEERKFHEFIADATIFDLDENTVIETIEVRRKYKIKLPDAIIAATALIYNQSLITRNTKDFSKIEGLKVIDPFDL